MIRVCKTQPFPLELATEDVWDNFVAVKWIGKHSHILMWLIPIIMENH